MLATDREVLAEARRLINDIGFCKGRSVFYANNDPKGDKLAFDICGAIAEACNRLVGISNSFCLSLQARDRIQAIVGYKEWLPEWNDEPTRTKSDVLSLFIEAIDSCKV